MWGMTMTQRDISEEDFWRKVKKRADGCWEWTGRKTAYGYGQVYVGGHWTGAHRMSYSLAAGVRAHPDMLVCHHCDNPGCVNPDHLFLGTHKDNIVE
jgi:Fe-S-cluster-containing dehydrogenase component